MTTENSNSNVDLTSSLEPLMATESVSVSGPVEAAPKRTKVEATASRIAYEENQLAVKTERLATLKADSKAHSRCVASIGKTEALLAQLRDSLRNRLLKAAPVESNTNAPVAVDQVG